MENKIVYLLEKLVRELERFNESMPCFRANTSHIETVQKLKEEEKRQKLATLEFIKKISK